VGGRSTTGRCLQPGSVGDGPIQLAYTYRNSARETVLRLLPLSKPTSTKLQTELHLAATARRAPSSPLN
jgi:hypothetical protein